MLVRAAGTGDWPQTASISASTDTTRFRFISSVASTARCLGAPNGTTVSPALSCKGPRTPNWRPAFDIARQPSGSTWVSDHYCDLDWLPRGVTARWRRPPLLNAAADAPLTRSSAANSAFQPRGPTHPSVLELLGTGYRPPGRLPGRRPSG